MSELKKHGNQLDNQQLVSGQWSGPLPPPSVLREFDGVVKDGAERIMRMAELEQEHRHSVEKLESISSAKDIRVGQLLGFIISLSSIIGCISTAFYGAHWSVSVALVGVPITGIVKAFLDKK